jgi:hypothetical protein
MELGVDGDVSDGGMGMVYRGHVENGVIRLDDAPILPEGVKAEVRLLTEDVAGEEAEVPSVCKTLKDFVGKAEGLPTDASVNYDHYLYGLPKRRRATIAYVIISTWIFGWLTATFGVLPAIFAAFILVLPAFFSWRMIASNRQIKRREYCYLAILTALVVVGISYLVTTWFECGIHELVIFDREYRAFHRQVKAMPEYRNVEVSYTNGKGGRVYLQGVVATKASHDRLIQMIEQMVRNNKSGYSDGVTYPETPSLDEPHPTDREHPQPGQDNSSKPDE